MFFYQWWGFPHSAAGTTLIYKVNTKLKSKSVDFESGSLHVQYGWGNDLIILWHYVLHELILPHVTIELLCFFGAVLILWHSYQHPEVQTCTFAFSIIQMPNAWTRSFHPNLKYSPFLVDVWLKSHRPDSLVAAEFESWGVWWRSLAVSYSLQWHVVLFAETRVSSSGETWQAKLLEIVIVSVAQG